MADVTQEQTRVPTLAEYRDALSQRPSEIVEGRIVAMHPTGRLHNRIVAKLFFSLYQFAAEHDLGEVSVESAFLLDADEREDWVRGSRLPDISFVQQARVEAHDTKYSDPSDPWRLAPDLVVEVVSPTDRFSDVNRKVDDYLAYGVQLVWIIDPARRKIRVHTPDQPLGIDLDDTATLDGGEVLPGWSMAVSEVLNVPGMDSTAASDQ